MPETDPQAESAPIRPFADFGEATGLLWLLNRVVFHPRGFAFALHYDDDRNAVGWSLLGDGTESWSMGCSPEMQAIEDARFAAVQALFRALTPIARQLTVEEGVIRWHDTTTGADYKQVDGQWVLDTQADGFTHTIWLTCGCHFRLNYESREPSAQINDWNVCWRHSAATGKYETDTGDAIRERDQQTIRIVKEPYHCEVCK